MKVFVYGTLRDGEANAYFLNESEKLGEECLLSGYTLYDLGAYPAAVASLEGAPLHGEVYQINDSILHNLDVLEEYPVEYDRVEVETSFGKAWLYVYNHSVAGLPVIANGDWCHRNRAISA